MVSKEFYRLLRYQILERHLYGVTAKYRILPNFIIIGAKRCGTTSLYHHLGEHPCIIRAKRDNVGFFNNNFELGLNYYKSFFPSIWSKNRIISKEKYFMTFDVTTGYLLNPIVATNISETIPDVKLILIVRNPVDRAYSEYNLITNQKSFEELISDEINKTDRGNNNTLGNVIDFTKNESFLLRKGMYAKQLFPWFKIFPKDQFLILSAEDYAVTPQKVYNDIFKFLGLPQYQITNMQKVNKGSYAQMNTPTRELLVNYFRRYNDDFFKLIGKSFDWNK